LLNINFWDNLKQKYIIISFQPSSLSLLSLFLLTIKRLLFWPITQPQPCELILQLSIQATQPTCRKAIIAIQHLEI
jgi:hypothetical protein